MLTMHLPKRGSPYSPWTCPTAEHPTQYGPAHCSTSYWLLTCPIEKYPTHQDLPHRGKPNSMWSSPLQNILLIVDLPHKETSYTPWTFPTAENPSHRGTTLQRNTLFIMDLSDLKLCYRVCFDLGNFPLWRGNNSQTHIQTNIATYRLKLFKGPIQ